MRLAIASTVLVIAAGCATAPASAQTATIAVTHDDPDGFVLPGETVRVTMRISWTPVVQLAGFAGDLRADPVAGGAPGAISNRFSAFHPSALILPGSIVDDDILGIDIASIPGFFTPLVPPPWGNYTGFDAFAHDWTAPATPGQYDFLFIPRELRPHVLVYPNVNSPAFAEAQTTYLSARITVIPTPAAAIPFLLAAVAAPRRRTAQ